MSLENRPVRYALWLNPSRQGSQEIQDIIVKLSNTHGGPVFEPHITLLGTLIGQLPALKARAASLADACRVFTITAKEIQGNSNIWQSLYLHIAQSKELLILHKEALEIFKARKTSQFMPHISLFYGEQPKPEKQRMKETISSICPFTTEIESLSIVEISGAADKWFTVNKYPLCR